MHPSACTRLTGLTTRCCCRQRRNSDSSDAVVGEFSPRPRYSWGEATSRALRHQGQRMRVHLGRLSPGPLSGAGEEPSFQDGLPLSLILTQFKVVSRLARTCRAHFCVVPVPESLYPSSGKRNLHRSSPGTTIGWFFHMVSDMAGSGGPAHGRHRIP